MANSNLKHFFNNKGTHFQKDTILPEDGKLVNDQQEVCNILNDVFVNVAKNIGGNSIPVDSKHPSSVKIQENLLEPSVLNFKPVVEDFISKQIDKLSLKKATGHDGISSKILRLAKPSVLKPVTKLINGTIKASEFTIDSKKALLPQFIKRTVH